MSIPVQAKVTVLTKYVNEFKRDNGEVSHYFNLTTIQNDRPEIIPVKKEVYDAVVQGGTYLLGGSVGGSGKDRWWAFNDVLKNCSSEK